ncbi:pentatricopeptide repeat-containing protein 2, mitochondrial [Papilio machaon]|uniref:pentatricopeptide repeat-containing protein 2, mitochondrial n=1 Tax=Papilio machaon TaxID=76193 RepID=UPI001E665BE2|nr:pentatricopeptide repeat-containing protein 2, mitochondrial [Papilio machaon]
MTMFAKSIKAFCNSRSLLYSRSIHVTKALNLYSPTALGIDGYLQSRKRVKDQFFNFTDTFRAKMRDFVSEPKHMIFTEDLKNMVHMAEPTDLDLVLNMIKKFNNQNVEFRFGSFIFGPVVMRMFHFLDAPNEALKSFEDPENSGFYDQLVSYQILLDLLYNHEMFDEMYRVFEKVQEKQLNMTKFPKYPVILVLAACYKQNTPKSLEYATKIWTEMTSVGTVPVRRAATLFAALALNQGAPHIALESISMQKPHYVTIRNIKAIALAEMGRVDDALPILRAVMDVDLPEQNHKHTFFEETISKVRSCVEKTENKDVQKEFANIEKALRDRDLIDSQTLDSLVTSEINLTTKNPRKPQGMPQMPYSMRKNKQNTRENMV